ncbi:MAG: hypothetical protein HQL68_01990, partial [Magnetococcales bacterium]|nr:hypothetical protein [Magnetococcales bacterium]
MISTLSDFSPIPTEELSQALMSVDRIKARSIVGAYAVDHSPFELVENLFSPVMELIGEGWES